MSENEAREQSLLTELLILWCLMEIYWFRVFQHKLMYILLLQFLFFINDLIIVFWWLFVTIYLDIDIWLSRLNILLRLKRSMRNCHKLWIPRFVWVTKKDVKKPPEKVSIVFWLRFFDSRLLKVCPSFLNPFFIEKLCVVLQVGRYPDILSDHGVYHL